MTLRPVFSLRFVTDDGDAALLHFFPNATGEVEPPEAVIVPRAETLLVIAGAVDIAIRGLSFAHTTDALLEPYRVPSAGDWAVRESGALEIRDGARGVEIASCNFERVGGNAVLVAGNATDIRLSELDVFAPGSSAVVVMGSVARDNAAADARFPDGVAIDRLVCSEVGVLAKQSSALFVALARNVSVSDSVLFNGPRAAINLNDGFGGGHSIEGSVIFNWVRETQDHGPINTVRARESWGSREWVSRAHICFARALSSPKWDRQKY